MILKGITGIDSLTNKTIILFDLKEQYRLNSLFS